MGSMTTYSVEDWFTADDLDSMPDDGQRYELLDGEVLVTPAPRVIHQSVVTELVYALKSALPPGMRVLTAPTDVRFSVRRQLQPDVLVVVDGPLDVPRIEEPPLLVVEVLSKSTRSRDLVGKRAAYQDAGVPSYWLVDTKVPCLTVLELVEGAYRECTFTAERAFEGTAPFPVRIVPAELVR